MSQNLNNAAGSKRIALLLSCIFYLAGTDSFITLVSAEEGDLLWSQNYGAEYADYVYSLIETNSGEYLMAGATFLPSAGDWDVWLLSVAADGDSLWSNTFGGQGNEFAFAIIETDDDSLLISGWTASFGAGESDMWLIKTNLAGDSLWSCTFGGENSDYSYSMTETSEGNVLLAGATASYGAGALDMWLVKTDPFGDTLWTSALGGPGTETIFSVIEASDGGYFCVGTTSSTPTSLNDLWIVKTDANGELIRSQSYGCIYDDCAYNITETLEGEFVLVGCSNSFMTPGEDDDIWLMKVDSEGDSLWSRVYGGDNDDFASAVIETDDNGYLIAGWSRSFGSGDSDVWLIKTDSDGDSLWSRLFGGVGDDYAHSIIQTSDGNYLIAGETHSFGPDVWDAWLVCVEGIPIGIEPEVCLQPLEYVLQNAFPNPFNASTVIGFQLPVAGMLKLEVIDLQGRLITTLADDWYAPGNYHVTFDKINISSGLYFYRLVTADYTASGKMVLIK